MSRLAPGMRVVGLFAVLALIAALEYGAGVAAGWGRLAYLLPLAIDTFVLGVLLAERSRLADRLFALGLVEFTVVVSAVAGGHEGNILLGGVLATALVLTLWRQDETIRRERHDGDELARLQAALDDVTARARQAEADARSAVAEAVAATVAEQEALRAQVVADAVAAAKARQGQTPRPGGKSATVPDADLERIIRETLAARSDAGFPAVTQAIKDAGWLVGNTERVKDALRAQKTPSPLRVVAGSK